MLPKKYKNSVFQKIYLIMETCKYIYYAFHNHHLLVRLDLFFIDSTFGSISILCLNKFLSIHIYMYYVYCPEQTQTDYSWSTRNIKKTEWTKKYIILYHT